MKEDFKADKVRDLGLEELLELIVRYGRFLLR